jgi:hypothetical protein
MRTLVSKYWFRLSLAATACLLALDLLACWHWHIWRPADLREYREVCRYSIGRDLWFGRITPDHDVEVLIERLPPHRIRRFGRFTCLTYFAGRPPGPGEIPFENLEVVARDGRLVSAIAGGCTWNHFFFKMSEEDDAEFQQAFHRYVEERVKARSGP